MVWIGLDQIEGIQNLACRLWSCYCRVSVAATAALLLPLELGIGIAGGYLQWLLLLLQFR